MHYRYQARVATAHDAQIVAAIYNAAVVEGGASADTAAVSVASRREWIEAHTDPYAVFIIEAVDEQGVPSIPVAFCALSNYYPRPGYDGVTDLAYYVAPEWRRRGVGQFALRTLLDEARNRGMRKAVCIIFADNTASIALCTSFGFTRFGLMAQAATDALGVMRDMAYYDLDL
ncbi:GNAT family N-acetyltransferase [Bifidobacterium gallicum]|uniref:Acetyltransferase, GNAT family n=1 Tax=Bifidobacterium gallicum DSM 20093 = LMG 11596 TaxID=561180 RepID=D1NS43_9BIFI|nr:GNAT family N-acetyltransferase [Bifidobacterium gallicum]EFA23495.1 acetyltransferase, GNAT family [Bifidobacterium gallicum DSM 20093 = LMG 11596]KFI57223.1 GNAT family acetyltransferase [Bifidobacterium gallicum DSM 20093 = LMG 11596]